MSRHATLLRPPVRLTIVLGVVLTLVLSTGGAALAAPPKVPSFGKAIDAYARYEGPKSCLSTEQPGVRDFRALLQQAYGANAGGIRRACTSSTPSSEHHEGRAYDWMLDANRASDKAKADEFLSWLLATDQHGNKHAMARRFGVMYIIWNKRVWKAYQADRGWQPYSGYSPHTDHIHFSFSWAGAKRQTTYWTAANSTPSSGTSFPDVPAGSFYAAPVEWMVGHKITDGFGNSGEFRPHVAVTRGQMAAFLWRMMDSPSGHPAHGFPDVSSSAYYEPAVRWLKASGITDGYGNTGRFEPDRQVSRGEMATFLWRTVSRPQGDPRHAFPDVSRDAHYDQAVSWLSAHAITNGYGNTGRFEPKLSVTRAETATFMYRLAGNADAWRGAPTRPSSIR